jgi:hypothetical protein
MRSLQTVSGQVAQPAGNTRCFGIDAEDGRAAALVERRGAESRPAEWYSLDETGLDALATRIARCGGRARVCVSSRGERSLDVAGRVSRSPGVELLLLFERNRPACAGSAAQAVHAAELARSAQRAI